MADPSRHSSISIDEDFLKGYIAKGGKATVIASGQQITTESEADQFLQGHISDKKTQKLAAGTAAKLTSDDKHLALLRQRADRLALEQGREARLSSAEMRRQGLQPGAGTAKERAERRRAIRAGAVIVEHVDKGIGPVADKIGSAPTVGGIGLLVGVIVLLLFIVVQVNAEGDTRLKQFWYMLNGRAQLIGAKKPSGAQTSATESTKGIQGNIPMPIGGCPTGYHPIYDSTGFAQCAPDVGGGPSPMVLYPLGSPYRTITNG
jgi:hypothetical protein